MNKQEASKIAKGFFKTYPSVKEFSVTSDGQAFESKYHADSHAATLKEKEIFTIDRNAPADEKNEETTEEKTEETTETETTEETTEETETEETETEETAPVEKSKRKRKPAVKKS